MKKFVMRSVLLLAVALLFGLTLEVPAAVASFTADSNITVTGVTFGTATVDMLIMSGSTSDSWEISGGVFTVSSPGENFKIGSVDSSVKTITAYRSGSLVACAVNTTAGSSTMTLPTTGGLYTITPSTANSCATTAGAIAPGGGTSSSSSAPSSYQSYDPSTGKTSTEAPKVETPKTEAPKTTEAAPATAPAASGAKVLTKVVVSQKDAKYIGSLSELKKLASWQIWKDTTTGKLYKIEAKTVKAANVVRKKLDTVLKAVTKKAAPAVTLSRYLDYGSKGTDVSALQELLKSEGVYPGGVVNGSYNSATRTAVQRFQVKYGIAKKGQLGYGAVGTATRAKVNALLGK